MDRRSGRLQNIVNRIKIRLLPVPRTEMPQRRHGETASGNGEKETAIGKTAIGKREKRRNARRNGALLLQKRVLYPEALRKANPIRIFSEEELRKATDNYDPSRRIGYKYNDYFKGTIDDGREITVGERPGGTNDSMVTAIVIQSSINHKNIAKLLGCCLETVWPVLVYESLSNGSLANHIQTLAWSDRLRIAAETAEAVNYLHTHSSMAIVHKDVKPANIVLDEHWTAKISGFSILSTITADNILRADSGVAGTFGYVEPEYMQTGVLSEKIDVYSFGVVMLELLTGEEMSVHGVDELLAQVISESVNLGGFSSTSPAVAPAPETAGFIASRVVEEGRPEQIQAFAQVAKNCLRERGERPMMKEVVLELWRIRSKEEAAVAG